MKAGGPYFVTSLGEPVAWDSSPISIHIESGSCGPFSNEEMLLQIEEPLDAWSEATGGLLTFNVLEGVIGSVDGTNYNDYFFDEVDTSDDDDSDSINPFVFDDDGEITQAIFGPSLGSQAKFVVLGFASPDGYGSEDATISDGQIFINCVCVEGNNSDICSSSDSEDSVLFTMTHELGHMLGLDHTQVNQNIAEGACDDTVSGDCDAVPTMFPQSVDAPDQNTISRDDTVALLTLYGLTDLENNFCTVIGELTDSDGNPLRCADVQATTSTPSDTIASVSGVFAPATDLDGDGYTDGENEVTSECGDFILRGLDPSLSYTITVKPIDSSWRNGSGINPCNPQLSGIVEKEVATIDAGECSAGATLDLGILPTDSTGGLEVCETTRETSSGGCSFVKDLHERSLSFIYILFLISYAYFSIFYFYLKR